LVAFSLFAGVFTYKMLGAKNPYFYFVAIFVTAIICLGGGVESPDAFNTTVLRVQETGLGILVYTLVSVFIWPQNTKAALDDASRKLVAVQGQLLRCYRDVLLAKETKNEAQQLRLQYAQLTAQFTQALEGAEADSFVVWESRHQWWRFKALSEDLGEALERWRATFDEVIEFDLRSLCPNLESTLSGLSNRIEEVGTALEGDVSHHRPGHQGLEIDRSAVTELSHLQRSALAITKAQIDRIDALIGTLLDCVTGIRGQRAHVSAPPDNQPSRQGFYLDVDRLGAAVRVMAGLWIGFLIWIYIDPPAVELMLILLASVGVAVVQMPWVAVWKLYVPFTLSAVFAGVIYIFVMPHLTGYVELGLLIFAITFIICYLFSEPRHFLMRAVGLALFLLFISVENQQIYSFSGYANQVAVIFVAILVLIVAAYIPSSPRPEKMFLRLVRRFFRHAELLTSRLSLDWEKERSSIDRWKAAFYRNDLLEMPLKLALWGRHIDHRTFPENDPERVQAIIGSLDILAHRAKMLMDVRQRAHADFLVEELHQEFRTWRIALQEVLQGLGSNPGSGSGAELEEALATKLKNLENRINAVFTQPGKDTLTDEDFDNFHQLLAAFRLLSEAIVSHVHLATSINWSHWKEVRF
jgi:uncharacterized membrane protein YccC